MDIEVVADDVPARDQRISGNDGLHMGQEIFFGARGATKGRDKLSRHDVATQNETPCSMTLVLKFPSLHMTRDQGKSRMLALERLHPGQLVGTHGALSLLHERRRLV